MLTHTPTTAALFVGNEGMLVFGLLLLLLLLIFGMRNAERMRWFIVNLRGFMVTLVDIITFALRYSRDILAVTLRFINV